MNSLTLILLFFVFAFAILMPSEKSIVTDFNIKIEGQVVNKLGETSKSTNGLLVEYIRNGTPRGSDLTDANGSFMINGVVTGINDIKDIENQIKLTGANPFEYETKIEISVKTPGKVMASTIDGKILDMTELPREGTYTLSYDGLGSPDGMQIISAATNDWKGAVKVIKRGSRTAADGKGLDVIAYSQDINLDELTLKGATITEEDSIKITGKNISQTFHQFYHERQDVNLGQETVNQGPEIKQNIVTKNMPTGESLETELNTYVYNDDQSQYLTKNPDFTISGSKIQFTTNVAGNYETWVEVIDGENSALKDSLLYKVTVEENKDLTVPEFILTNLIAGKEDETIRLKLDLLAKDNKTAPEKIAWEITNGSFTTSTISGREGVLTSAKDKNGEDKLTITITDEAGNKASKEVRIDYASIPDAPIANDDLDETKFETSKITNVLANDTDVENNIFQAMTKVITNPKDGIAKANIDGTITYTPNKGFTGTDTYNYEITDGTNLKDTAKVTINVSTNPNTTPSIQDIPIDSTDEDTPKKGLMLDEIVSDDFTSDDKIAWTISVDKPDLLEVSLDTNRQVEYKPKADKNGIVEITYTAKDEEGLVSSKTQNFTINPVNDAPRQVSQIANQTSPEDETLKIDLENKFSDPENETITYKLLNLPESWTIVWSGTEASISTPKDYNGTIEGLIIEAVDSNQNKIQSNTFSITKTAVNDAPNAINDNASTEYQTSKTINVLVNDTDIDGELNKASITIEQNPTNGTITGINQVTGEISYKPNNGFTGTDNFKYTVKDTEGLESNEATVTITVGDAPNQRPTANDDLVATNEDLATTIDVLANDTDDHGLNPASVTITSQPNHGTTSVNVTNGRITYTPAADNKNEVTFQYSVADNEGLKDIATVNVTINAVDDAPRKLADIVNQSNAEDVTLTFDVAGKFVEPDGEAMTYSMLNLPAGWTSTWSGTNASVSAPADYNGTVTGIKVEAKDPQNNSVQSNAFSITKTAVDDTPRKLADIANQSNAEDVTLTFDIAGKFGEPDNEAMSYSLLNLPAGWTSTWSGTNVSVTAPSNYNGTITDLAVKAKDPQNNEVQSNNFTITKTAVNDAPIASNDNASTNYQTAKNDMDVAVNDTDIDGNLNILSTYITQNPTNGNASVGTDGKIDYTPNSGFSGTDIIKYKIKDTNNAESNEATLTIAVGDAPNQRPTANDDLVATNEDLATTIDVLANDTDDHGLNPASVTVITAPAHGSTSVNATNGRITYTPASDNNNDVTFQYSVADNEGLKDTATVNVTINAIDDAPRKLADIVNQSNAEDVTLTFDVAGKFTEPDGEAMTYSMLNLPAGWSSSWSGTNVNVSAPADYNGIVTDIKVEAKDPQNNSVQSNAFTITKTAVDDAPRKLADIANQSNLEDVTLTFSVASNFNEPDGEALTYSLSNLPGGWSSTWSGTNVSVTAPSNYNGTITGLAVKAKDPQNNEVQSNNFTITKTAVNDPVGFAGTIDNIVLNKNASTNIDLKNYFSDVETADADLTYALAGLSLGTYSISNGVLTITGTTVGSETDLRASASDEGTSANSNYFSLTVNNLPNTAPVIGTIPADNTNEDSQKTATFSLDTYVSDDYTSDANIQWSIAVSDQSKLSVSLDASRKPIYTPAADKNGAVTITYTATDEGGLSSSKTQSFTINAVDDAPRKLADIANQTNAEDVTLTFDVAGKFVEPDVEAMTYSMLNLPAGWTSTWNGTQASVSAPADYNGTVTGIKVEAKDPQNNSVQSNAFTITKTAVDDAPRLVENIANQSNLEDVVLTLDVAGKFSEPEGQAMTYSLLNLPSGWTSTWSGTQASVSAPADYNGTVTGIKVEAKDPGNNSVQSNAFTITKTAVDDAPRKLADIANQSNAEDVTLTVSVAGKFTEPDGEAMTYQLLNLPAGWSSTWSGTDVSVVAPSNYNGTISGLAVKAKDPQNNEVTSNNFTITKTAVNDPVGFAGTIDNIVLNKNASTNIDLKNYFSDVETADADLNYALAGLSLGTYSISNGVLTITGTTVGSETDLRASASDEGTSANSNYFGLTVNDVVEKSMVTFKFRNAAADTDLTSGTSTLRYKKSGDANYTTVTSTNGTFTIEMDKNIAYEIDGSHSGDLETAFSAPSIYVALKRPGDMEAFEQRAVGDANSPATFTSATETVYLYKLMNGFPLGPMQEYASKLSGVNIGTRKFSTSDSGAPLWVDKNYQSLTTTQLEWLNELKNELSGLPHVYLSLPIQEGTTAPGLPYTRIAVDASFPSPGTNSTLYNASTNTITKAEAKYPLSFGEGTFKIEILQAIGDLNDVGGVDPAILDGSGNLNSTGQQVFSVLYLFKPKTKF